MPDAETTQLSITDLRAALEALADPADVEPMEAYMKDQFRFMGVRSAGVRTAAKPFLAAARGVDGDGVIAFVHECWAQPEREFQYVGALFTRRHVRELDPSHLPDVEHFIVTKSWWDTVDSLAAWTVGPLVAANPELVAVMDQWIADENLWLARTAILHQLGYKDDTDAERLFRYAELQAGHTDFFIRKAIGWALRQHARVDPDAVRRFVADHEEQLSGLSKREALKHL
jgi:3-methyladenine DNA glycosylase AlkD